MSTAAPAGLDLEAIRARFPALARRDAEGRPISYLDGPGGSQVPLEVADAVRRYLLETNANLGGPFAASLASDELIDAAAARRPTWSAPRPTRSRSAPT